MLCIRLGLGGRGTRRLLIGKLRRWNRTAFRGDEAEEQGEEEDDEEDDEDEDSGHVSSCSSPASNFALLDLSLPVAAVARHRAQLTPLTARAVRAADGSPRSCLSTSSCSSPQPLPPLTPREAKRLSFSVFNGVQLIPARQLRYDEEEEAQGEAAA